MKLTKSSSGGQHSELVSIQSRVSFVERISSYHPVLLMRGDKSTVTKSSKNNFSSLNVDKEFHLNESCHKNFHTICSKLKINVENSQDLVSGRFSIVKNPFCSSLSIDFDNRCSKKLKNPLFILLQISRTPFIQNLSLDLSQFQKIDEKILFNFLHFIKTYNQLKSLTLNFNKILFSNQLTFKLISSTYALPLLRELNLSTKGYSFNLEDSDMSMKIHKFYSFDLFGLLSLLWSKFSGIHSFESNCQFENSDGEVEEPEQEPGNAEGNENNEEEDEENQNNQGGNPTIIVEGSVSSDSDDAPVQEIIEEEVVRGEWEELEIEKENELRVLLENLELRKNSSISRAEKPENYSKHLPVFTSLKSLNICFEDGSFEDLDWNSLAESLKKIFTLEEICINLSKSTLDPTILSNIFESLIESKNLKNVSITFQNNLWKLKEKLLKVQTQKEYLSCVEKMINLSANFDSIQFFEISIPENGGLIPLKEYIFRSGLSHLKNLIEISLNLNAFSQISEENVIEIVSVIKNAPNLYSLTCSSELDLGTDENLDLFDLRNYSKSLKNLSIKSSLVSFSFNNEEFKFTKNRANFEKFALDEIMLNNLKLLQSPTRSNLLLNFNNSKIKDPIIYFEELFTVMKAYPSLTNLILMTSDFKFNFNNKNLTITQNFVIEGSILFYLALNLLFDLFREINQLKIDHNQDPNLLVGPDDSVSNYLKKLESIDSVKKLEISFNNFPVITDQSIKLLSNFISCQKGLTHFNLILSNNANVSEAALSYLLEKLGNLKSIQELLIKFYEVQASESLIFANSLAYLKEINLQKFEFKSKSCFIQLKDSRQVFLKLEDSKLIDNHHALIYAKCLGLSSFCEATQIKLELNPGLNPETKTLNDKINSETFFELLSSLKNLSSLESAEIDFCGLSAFNSKGAEMIIDLMKTTSNISSFILNNSSIKMNYNNSRTCEINKNSTPFLSNDDFEMAGIFISKCPELNKITIQFGAGITLQFGAGMKIVPLDSFIEDGSFMNFFKSVSNQRVVKNMVVNLNGFDIINHKVFNHFADMIQNNTNGINCNISLKRLNFNYNISNKKFESSLNSSYKEQLCDEDLLTLVNFMQSIKNIQEMNINLCIYDKIDSEIIKRIEGNTLINMETLCKLFTSIKELSSLKTLHLNLNGIPNILNLPDPISTLFSHFASQKLNSTVINVYYKFDFSYNPFKLNISIPNKNVFCDQIFKTFAAVLHQNSNLEQLICEFSNLKLSSDEHFTDFLQALSKLQSIKQININQTGSELSLRLVEQIIDHLRNLKTLGNMEYRLMNSYIYKTIDEVKITPIDSKTFNKENIKISLKFLGLPFMECKKVHIDFQNVVQFEDENISLMCESLLNLQNAKDLWIFIKEAKITDLGLLKLWDAVKQMKNLQEFKLMLDGNKAITSDSITTIYTTFNEGPKFNNFEISLKQLNLEPKTIEDLQNALKNSFSQNRIYK